MSDKLSGEYEGELFLDPTRESFDAFKALPRDRPINMLNLLRFHEQAQYPEGHINADKGWSGVRAYEEYGTTSGPVFKRVGGTILWRGKMESMLIGPQQKQWDTSFIARYPTGGAFLEMITDPEYQKAVINRQAGVLTSRLIRFGELDGPNEFG